MPKLSEAMAQNLVFEALATALFVYLFLSSNEELKMNKCLWYIIVFFVMTMVANHRMNPASFLTSVFQAAKGDDWSGPTVNDVGMLLGSVLGALGGALVRSFVDDQ